MIRMNIETKSSNEIVLQDKDAIEKFYENLENNYDFIVTWKNEKIQYSELIIANNIIGKVKTGDIKLTSVEEMK